MLVLGYGQHISLGHLGSATVLILGNSRIAKIVNLRFLLFRRCAISAHWGPPQTPGFFEA